MAVVGGLYELKASVLDDDVNGGGPSVEVVLDELFHGGVRTLDHLFDGDPIHDRGNSLPPSLRPSIPALRVVEILICDVQILNVIYR